MSTAAEQNFEFTQMIGRVWCRVMHDSPMWPIHGHYQCGACGRHFPVRWADAQPNTLMSKLGAGYQPVGTMATQ